jgi:glucan phosphoethanolaminetransferase (alkaline phosphatase superfamily)
MRNNEDCRTEDFPCQNRKKYLRQYLLFMVLRISASLGIIILFIRQFGFSAYLIIYHIITIFALLLVEMLFLILLLNIKKFKEWKPSGIVLLVIQGMSIFVIYSCYVLGYVSYTLWGSYITFAIIASFLPQFAGLIRALPVNTLLIVGVVLSVPLFAAGTVIALSKTLIYGVKELAYLYNKHIINRLMIHRLRIAVFMVIFIAGVAAPFAIIIGIPKAKSIGDPVVTILVSVLKKQANDIGNSGFTAADERSRYPKIKNSPKKNIILIICDSLRQDHMSLYGYNRKTTPYLDRLYRNHKLFRQERSFSTCSVSYCGIMSTLTSKSWNEIGISNFSLQDVLKKQGYRINFILSGDHTSWENLKVSYGSSIDYYFDGCNSKQFSINDDLLVFEAMESLPDHNDQPNFFYIHLMSTHVVGIKHVKKYAPTMIKGMLDSENSKICYTNNYDNGIVQADRFIERIISVLKRKGYLENFMMAITSDHGEEIYEKNGVGHKINLYWYSMEIPFIIYDNDPAVYKEQQFASQIDIAATIVDRLGLPAPESWEGLSLLRKNPYRCTIHQAGDYIAVIVQHGKTIYKYIYNKKSMEEQLYDISTDDHEKNNVITHAPREVLHTCRDKIRNSLGIIIH